MNVARVLSAFCLPPAILSLSKPSSVFLPEKSTAFTAGKPRAMSLGAPPSAIKPPNVLVLQPQATPKDGSSFLSLKDSLTACLNPERYIIYPLGLDDALRTPWKENCSLLVVPSRLTLCPPQIYHEIASFVHSGGILLSLEAAINTILGFKFEGHIEPNNVFNVTPAGEEERRDFTTLSVSTISSLDEVQFASEIPFDPGVSRENLAYLTPSSPTSSQVPLESSEQFNPRSDEANGAGGSEGLSCVQGVRFSKGGRALLSYIDLLSVTHEGTDLSSLLQLKKDVESQQEFLKGALRGVGLECSVEAMPQLSYTYLVCSAEVMITVRWSHP